MISITSSIVVMFDCVGSEIHWLERPRMLRSCASLVNAALIHYFDISLDAYIEDMLLIELISL